MKKTIAILSAVLLLGTCLLLSCSNKKKAEVMIYDGELQWSSIMSSRIMVGSSPEGIPQIWGPLFQTEIGNSLRTLSFQIFTSEPGVYSGYYDASTGKWSTNIIGFISLAVDYDGTPYPNWYGQSATVTIQSFDKRSKQINATLEAVIVMEGTSNSRNLRVDFHNVVLNGN